ncbi:MAG: type IX secretion system outer membrane channel protein PorV [Flavobacteriaceae bacterium]|nr:type IX secretion system outer membrane channel protein PorV [Bacteroidia bacterium]NNL16317.1 type IX secretion system outer membrane channel protein PorV [Flavobacteriaceae bacterium]
MRNRILVLIALVFIFQISAQETVVFDNQTSVITTGVPFLLIASDARAAALGDMGVATSVDAFSQNWNPSKYTFSTYRSGLGVSYTPYLSKLVNDIFLGNLTYFNRLNERSAFAASFKYFSLGEIEITDIQGTVLDQVKPNEFTIDATYSLRLGDQFAMAVTGRYLTSDLKINAVDPDAGSASSFAVDISGFYQSEEKAYSDFNGRWRGGFALQNIGPKIQYDDAGRENFLPTTMRLGGGFDFIFDEYNKLAVTAEITKLLVPSPPIYGYVDTDGNGDQNTDPNSSEYEPTIIVEGKDPDVSFIKGIFQSFGDAPGGFSEELKEFTWALSAEYLYQDSFAIRAGYFNESEDKGARKFFGLGAGFKYNVANIDLSYLFSASKVQSPLEGTLRFSLSFNLGDGEYSEY